MEETLADPKSYFERNYENPWYNLSFLWHPKRLYHRFIYERPNAGFRKRLHAKHAEDGGVFAKHVESFEAEGHASFPSYFSGVSLQALQAEFEELIRTRSRDSGHGCREVIGTPFAGSPALTRALMDPYLLDVVRYYWGKEVVLTLSNLIRTEPAPPKDYSSFQWHHDGKRKQVHVLILLTDLPRGGQSTHYRRGTHKLWHRLENSYESRIPSSVIEYFGKPVELFGPAGSVFVFDSNGIHRGNRNLGPRRDAAIFVYSAGKFAQSLEGVHVPTLGETAPADREVLRVDSNGQRR